MSSGTLISMSLRVALPVSVLAVLAACKGGGGSIGGDYQDTQDRPPSSVDSAIARTNKSATVLNESIAATNERGTTSGGSGAGGFNCLGTFKCTASTNLTGKSSQSTTLSLPGVCSYQGSGFNADGTVTQNGKVVGSWEATSTGFKITETATVTSGKSSTTVSVSLHCVKISDEFNPNAIGSGDDDDDIQAPPEQGSSGSTVVIDAGAR